MYRDSYSISGKTELKHLTLLLLIILLPHFYNDLQSQDIDGKSDKSLIRMSAGYSDNINSFDPLVIYYDENATYNFDGQLDAYKLFNTDAAVTNFYVFGNDATRQSISAIPFSGGAPCCLKLGLKTAREGDVVIRITEVTGIYSGTGIRLNDLTTGESAELSTDRTYTIHLAAGDYRGRFCLDLSGSLTGTGETITDAGAGFTISTFEGFIRTDIRLPGNNSGLLTIFNLNGESVYTRRIRASGFYEIFPGIVSGFYIVTLSTGKKRYSKKIIYRG